MSILQDFEEEIEVDQNSDSDEELKEAFAAGLLKPGLNLVQDAPLKKEVKNNIPALKQKLMELQRSLPWVERLDLINDPAPIAPELAYKEEQHNRELQKTAGAKGGKGAGAGGSQVELVHNDFKREMLFYRQAQAAVLEGIERLKDLKVSTKRPEDYFAQMVKTDNHMQKIREKLLSKQQVQEKIEKVKKLRELKKYGKKVQVEVQQNRLKEKKQLIENVKKFRKGKSDSLDFLDDSGKGKSGKDRRVNSKRKSKDDKFGFGGKKRGLKKNTKDSNDAVSEYRRPSFHKSTGKGNMRPGKERRKKLKNKNKK